MGKVRFGKKQFNNPTPANWSSGITVATVVIGIIITWLGSTTFIGPNTIAISQSIGGLLITLMNGLKPFLGVVTPQTSIPKGDVTAMEVSN